jgi:hypothetical protein
VRLKRVVCWVSMAEGRLFVLGVVDADRGAALEYVFVGKDWRFDARAIRDY